MTNQHTPARRAWAVEGTGSYGAGVTTYLAAGELVAEFNDPTPTRDGAKTDALDARRAARQVLGRTWRSPNQGTTRSSPGWVGAQNGVTAQRSKPWS